LTYLNTGRANSRLVAAPRKWSIQMLDLLMLAIGLAFFALSAGYVYACERL
jgi:hypothetical protein